MKLIATIFLISMALSSVSISAFAAGSHGGGHGHEDTRNGYNDGHGHDDAHGQAAHASMVGSPAKSNMANKTVHVEMLDSMRFVFKKDFMIKTGDIIRFVVTNKGKIKHEFSIGNSAEQSAHAQMMRNMPNMIHEDGNTISVEPGKTKDITWRFKGNEQAIFSCNVPGHFEAGMHAARKIKQ